MHACCCRDFLVSYSWIRATDPSGHLAIATISWNTTSGHHYPGCPREAIPGIIEMVITFTSSRTYPVSA